MATPFFKFDSFDVRRRLVPSSGLYEYKARGVFPNVEVSTLLAVYMDLDYRVSWDPHVLEAHDLPTPSVGASTAAPQQLDSAPPPSVVTNLFAPAPALDVAPISPGADSGVEMAPALVPSLIGQRLSCLQSKHIRPTHYYYAIRMPFPFSTRDYVYTVQSWCEGPHNFLVQGLSCKHPEKEDIKGNVRIEDYYQQIAVKKVEGGTMLGMRYYDNPRASIPPALINMAAQKGVPMFVKGLLDACANYETWIKKKAEQTS
ncbi:hypothetical protein HK101_005470 [Irineochytrium annulatum]|nr:hypothetical protein HK101_005470 [Irineochytrium annulatum]